jgi:serine/threonine protein kinase
MVGTTVSHYRILEHIGGGGMGAVYKAQDLKLDHCDAVKFLLPPFLPMKNHRRKGSETRTNQIFYSQERNRISVTIFPRCERRPYANQG